VACALVLSIPFSLISVLLGLRWMVHLRTVSLHAWSGMVCLLLALFLVDWPQRVERYVRAQSPAHAVLHSVAEEHGGSAPGDFDGPRAPRMP
jgi:hypothetical protein